MVKAKNKKGSSDQRWNSYLNSNFKRIDSKVSHVEPWAIKVWHQLKEDVKKDRIVNENIKELRNETAVDNLRGVKKELGEYFESDAAVKNEKAEYHFKNFSKEKIEDPSFKWGPFKEETNLDVKEEKLEIKEETLGFSDVKKEPIDSSMLKVKTELDAKKPSIKGDTKRDVKEESLEMKHLVCLSEIDGVRYSKLKNLALKEEKYFNIKVEQHGQNQSTSAAQRPKGL